MLRDVYEVGTVKGTIRRVADNRFIAFPSV